MIPPHGGVLVDRRLSGHERRTALENAHALPRVALSERGLADLECLAHGVYSPLEGFVGEAAYRSIVDTMRLPCGIAWTVPVTLQVDEAAARRCPLGGEIALVAPTGGIVAVMTVTDKFRPDQDLEARRIYGTPEEAHPGVAAMRAEGPVYLGGPVRIVDDLPAADFLQYRFSPAQTRAAFAERGWQTVVAFQTRNPIHRAHEYITKAALELVDGLFINPLVGTTKSDDVPADVRMRCYEVLIDRYYRTESVLLGVFPAAMRYAGPREAVMHAIARQNYGCTHFIVGRDHAGIGSYYGTYDAQKVFDEFSSVELAIVPMKFEHAFYCTVTQTMATQKTSPSRPDQRIELSGTRVREMLGRGEIPPPEFTRPEVARILAESMQIAAAS
jgi:sulfate adenylyltransferase